MKTKTISQLPSFFLFYTSSFLVLTPWVLAIASFFLMLPVLFAYQGDVMGLYGHLTQDVLSPVNESYLSFFTVPFYLLFIVPGSFCLQHGSLGQCEVYSLDAIYAQSTTLPGVLGLVATVALLTYCLAFTLRCVKSMMGISDQQAHVMFGCWVLAGALLTVIF